MTKYFLIAIVVVALAIVCTNRPARSATEPVVVGMGACPSMSTCTTPPEFLSYLEGAGYTATSPTYSSNNLLNAYKLRDAINAARATSPTGKVKVVGLSMGGYSALYTLKVLGMHQYVSELVVVDSPVFGHPNNFWLCIDLWLTGGNNGGHLCKSSSYYKAIHRGDPTPGSTRYSMILNYHPEGFAGSMNPDVLDGVVCTHSVNMPHIDVFYDSSTRNKLLSMLEGGC